MQTITTVGLDIAKSVFQVHCVDADGKVVLRRQLKRRYVLAFFQKLPPCLVGIEACASSHHWSRELQALGHTVRLMPPCQKMRGHRRAACIAKSMTWFRSQVGAGFGLKTDDYIDESDPCV
jgi:transposase